MALAEELQVHARQIRGGTSRKSSSGGGGDLPIIPNGYNGLVYPLVGTPS